MRSIALVIIAVVISLLSFWIPNDAIADGVGQQVCDVSADYSLGTEDYSEAVRRHADVVRKHPDNALAHYHLGFAFGMADDRMSELREYQQAEALGLRSWDLFLNLGLAQLENGDLDAATDSLRHAVLLGEDHSESHFNLALVYQRRGMLADAQHEILASLLLNPGQPDARNLLGVIYAQEGESAGFGDGGRRFHRRGWWGGRRGGVSGTNFAGCTGAATAAGGEFWVNPGGSAAG